MSPGLVVGSRTYWCEFVQNFRNKKGKMVYEDPMKTYARLHRTDNSEGVSQRLKKYQFYEKPWMKRKRIKNERAYRTDKNKVEDLRRWIVFRQQNNLPVKNRREMSKEM